ncbi:MAG: carboxypeptidase regulatory-like domain-containing protein [Chitinophagaceae bacterium]|nr:carboxypeptidase regulatory-like domain-containing protein [Chitinophagaceae bacterium]
MKKTLFTLFATILTVAMLHAFRLMQSSSISGKIIPPEGSEMVWASSGRDSLKTTVMNGAFVFTAKPGTWRIVIIGKAPFKDAILERVDVKEGQNTDLGEIRLQQ